MSTLLISDLHLGSLLGRDVLRRPAALAALEDRIASVDRLVLLGDTLELLEGRPEAARAAARAVLPRLAAALGPGGEIVLVIGNHDHALIRSWLRERLEAGKPLAPTTRVPHRATPQLAALVRLLRPARVEVRHPGVWLADDVYAMHGHYADRLVLPALSGRLRTGHDADVGSAWDFEQAPGSDAGGVSGVLASALPDALGSGVEDVVGVARRTLLAGLPLVAGLPGMREVAQLGAVALEQGVHRRGAIPATAEVARRIGVDAAWVIFGHIHRRGPLPGDPPELWRPMGADGPRLLNTGSWVYDTALAGHGSEARPYRPGGAVLLREGRNPRSLDLLAGVPDRVLRGRL